MKLKILLIIFFIISCFCTVSQGFTVHTSYDASSDYALGDIVPSTDASVQFYQAVSNLPEELIRLATRALEGMNSSDILIQVLLLRMTHPNQHPMHQHLPIHHLTRAQTKPRKYLKE